MLAFDAFPLCVREIHRNQNDWFTGLSVTTQAFLGPGAPRVKPYTTFCDDAHMGYRYLVRFLLWIGLSASLYLLFAGIDYPWNWRVPWQYRTLFIMGFYYTLAVSIGAIFLGFCLGVLGRTCQSLRECHRSRACHALRRGLPGDAASRSDLRFLFLHCGCGPLRQCVDHRHGYPGIFFRSLYYGNG